MLISAMTYLQQRVKLPAVTVLSAQWKPIFDDLLMQSKIGICKITISYCLEKIFESMSILATL